MTLDPDHIINIIIGKMEQNNKIVDATEPFRLRGRQSDLACSNSLADLAAPARSISSTTTGR